MLGLTIRTPPPKVTLDFDRFHLLKLLNASLIELPRELQRKAEDDVQKQVLKGTRGLSPMHPANLDDTRNELQRLDEPLKLNESLATAYLKHHQSVGRQPRRRSPGCHDKTADRVPALPSVSATSKSTAQPPRISIETEELTRLRR